MSNLMHSTIFISITLSILCGYAIYIKKIDNISAQPKIHHRYVKHLSAKV